MNAPLAPEMNPVVHRFVQGAGSATQSLGIGRVVGQIYAFLYFSPEPKNLADLQGALGISKGSASMGVRQLEQWGAVRRIWVRGDRKDYYEANDWLGKILRNLVLDTAGKKILSYAAMLDDMESQLPAAGGGDGEFIRGRIRHLRAFQKKAQQVWKSPLVKMLLK